MEGKKFSGAINALCPIRGANQCKFSSSHSRITDPECIERTIIRGVSVTLYEPAHSDKTAEMLCIQTQALMESRVAINSTPKAAQRWSIRFWRKNELTTASSHAVPSSVLSDVGSCSSQHEEIGISTEKVSATETHKGGIRKIKDVFRDTSRFSLPNCCCCIPSRESSSSGKIYSPNKGTAPRSLDLIPRSTMEIPATIPAYTRCPRTGQGGGGFAGSGCDCNYFTENASTGS